MLSGFPADTFWSICKFMCLITHRSGWDLQCSVILLGWPWLKQTRDKKEERDQDWLEVSRLWPAQYSFERDTWYGLVGKRGWQREAKDRPEHRLRSKALPVQLSTSHCSNKYRPVKLHDVHYKYLKGWIRVNWDTFFPSHLNGKESQSTFYRQEELLWLIYSSLPSLLFICWVQKLTSEM